MDEGLDDKLTKDDEKEDNFSGFMIGKKQLNMKMDLTKAESLLAKL